MKEIKHKVFSWLVVIWVTLVVIMGIGILGFVVYRDSDGFIYGLIAVVNFGYMATLVYFNDRLRGYNARLDELEKMLREKE